MKRLTFIAFTTALLVAGSANAQASFGAIAWGQTAHGDGVAYGFAWNYPGRDEAKNAALSACLNNDGVNCTVLARFQNGCGALALDQFGNAQAKSAPSQEGAERRALQACQTAGWSGCNVVGSQCAVPDGQANAWSGSETIRQTERPDQAAGKPTEPQGEALTREERVSVQLGLAALGFKVGPADGVFGPLSRSAIREWQTAKEFKATGSLSRDQAKTLAAIGDDAQGSQRPLLATGSKCADLQGTYLDKNHAACWQEVENIPGCHLWNTHYHSSATVNWSGACHEGTVHGKGTFSIAEGSDHASFTGTGQFILGKSTGYWVQRRDNGTVSSGSYVDGRREGQWIFRYANNDFLKTHYRNGSRDGQKASYYGDFSSTFLGQFSSNGNCLWDNRGSLRRWWVDKEDCESAGPPKEVEKTKTEETAEKSKTQDEEVSLADKRGGNRRGAQDDAQKVTLDEHGCYEVPEGAIETEVEDHEILNSIYALIIGNNQFTGRVLMKMCVEGEGMRVRNGQLHTSRRVIPRPTSRTGRSPGFQYSKKHRTAGVIMRGGKVPRKKGTMSTMTLPYGSPAC